MYIMAGTEATKAPLKKVAGCICCTDCLSEKSRVFLAIGWQIESSLNILVE
jgi:hypothetical protein